jgi:orotidine-5'-phosphate decarboxylase
MAVPELQVLVQFQAGLNISGESRMTTTPADPRIIVALDYDHPEPALALARGLTPELCRLKVGKELFTASGPELVRQLVDMGHAVFLDLKFHDIPNTVGKAVAAASRLGVWMLNVHALGGRSMLQAAREAADGAARPPKLIAVSLLTSMDQSALSEVGIDKPVEQEVRDLTRLSLSAGLDGMVCSAREAPLLRREFGDGPLLVTPGIRPEGSARGDQQRVMTPRAALAAGSSYLVIGRPITQSPDPVGELERIRQSLDG